MDNSPNSCLPLSPTPLTLSQYLADHYDPHKLKLFPELKYPIYNTADYRNADGKAPRNPSCMTKSDMQDTLFRRMEAKVYPGGYTLPQDFEYLTELGRMICYHAYEYGHRNTRQFISLSERTVMHGRVDHGEEAREVMKAYYLKAVEIDATWSQEENSERAYAHLPWAQVQRQPTNPPDYEDEVPPPYKLFPD